MPATATGCPGGRDEPWHRLGGRRCPAPRRGRRPGSGANSRPVAGEIQTSEGVTGSVTVRLHSARPRVDDGDAAGHGHVEQPAVRGEPAVRRTPHAERRRRRMQPRRPPVGTSARCPARASATSSLPDGATPRPVGANGRSRHGARRGPAPTRQRRPALRPRASAIATRPPPPRGAACPPTAASRPAAPGSPDRAPSATRRPRRAASRRRGRRRAGARDPGWMRPRAACPRRDGRRGRSGPRWRRSARRRRR